MIKTINIKILQYPEIAAFALQKEIEICKLTDVNVLIAIHGYGSSGVGGEIKKEVLKLLHSLKTKNIIIDYFKGEECGATNILYKKLTSLEPALILNSQVQNLNSGITVVWVM